MGGEPEVLCAAISFPSSPDQNYAMPHLLIADDNELMRSTRRGFKSRPHRAMAMRIRDWRA